MIPLAEKTIKWDIPNEATKPPCTRHYTVELMKRLQEADRLSINLFSGNIEKCLSVYLYLSEWGFISIVDNSSRDKAVQSIKSAKMTDLRKELILKEIAATRTKEMKKTTEKKITFDAGVASGSYKVTTEEL